MPKAIKNKALTKKHLARIERERLQRRYILIGGLAVLILVVGFIGYGILDQTVLQPLQPVVKVNGDNVSTRDWQNLVRYTRQNIIQQYAQTYSFAQSFGSDPQTLQYFQSSLQQMQSQLDPYTLGQQVLDTTVEDALIKQEAKRRGIVVTDQELDKTLQGDFGYFPNGTPTALPTELPTQPPATLSPAQLAIVTATPTLTPTLTSTPSATPKPGLPTSTPTTIPSPTLVPSPTLTPTPYTEQAYKDNYQKTLDILKTIQISDSQFREIIRMQLLRQKVRDAIEADLSHEQDQVWVRQILVADEAAAKQVKARLDKGEDFAKVAKEVSTDTYTKDRGGDYGWQSRESLDPAYADVAFSMQIGQISNPVKTASGWYIIQLVGHEKKVLTNTEYDQLKTQKFQDWLTTERSKGTVKIYDYWQQRVPSTPTIPASLLQPLTG